MMTRCDVLGTLGLLLAGALGRAADRLPVNKSSGAYVVKTREPIYV